MEKISNESKGNNVEVKVNNNQKATEIVIGEVTNINHTSKSDFELIYKLTEPSEPILDLSKDGYMLKFICQEMSITKTYMTGSATNKVTYNNTSYHSDFISFTGEQIGFVNQALMFLGAMTEKQKFELNLIPLDLYTYFNIFNKLLFYPFIKIANDYGITEIEKLTITSFKLYTVKNGILSEVKIITSDEVIAEENKLFGNKILELCNIVRTSSTTNIKALIAMIENKLKKGEVE